MFFKSHGKMSRTIPLLSSLAAFFALAVFCVPGTLWAENELQVVSHSPTENLEYYYHTEAGMDFEIMVTFNGPVVALQDLATQTNKVKFIIDPPLKGIYKWKGPNTLSFRPENIPDDTAIKVTLPSGFSDIHGKLFKTAYTWSFNTKRPRLEKSKPYHNATHVVLDQEIELNFNMRMDTENIKDHILWLQGQQALDYSYKAYEVKKIISTNLECVEGHIKKMRVTRTNFFTNQAITLKPAKKMELFTKYSIIIKKGFHSVGGKLGFENDETVNFRTYGPLFYLGSKQIDFDPEKPLELEFTNQVKATDLIANSEFINYPNALSNIRPWSGYYFYDYYSDYYGYTSRERTRLKAGLIPDQEFSIKLTDKILDIYGNRLENPMTVKVRAQDYSPLISFGCAGRGIMESYLAGKIPVRMRNIHNFKLLYNVLDTDHIVHFDRIWCETNFNESLKYYERNTIIPDAAPRNETKNTNLNLKSIVGAEHGILMYQLINDEVPPYVERECHGIVQITELGLTCKFSPFKNIIFVTKLKDTSPVPGADIEIRDMENKVLFRGKTGTDGTCMAPGWYNLGLKDWPTIFIIAKKDGDITYIRNDMDQGISPDRCMSSFELDRVSWGEEQDNGGDYGYPGKYGWEDKGPPWYDCMIFTERGLYRPGEKVNIKAIAKFFLEDGWTAASGINASVRLENPRGELIWEDSNKKDFNPLGSLALTYDVPRDAPTGTYTIIIDDAKLRLRSEATFQVEEFKTASFKPSVLIDENHFYPGDKVNAVLKGWYLFNAPMAGAKCTYDITLQPYTPSFNRFQDFEFNFFDSELNENMEELCEDSIYNQNIALAQGSGVLDKDGVMTVSAQIDKNKVFYPMKVTVNMEVQDTDRRSLASATSRVVHPAQFYIGLRSDKLFWDTKQPASFSMITISPEQEILSGEKVELDITRLDWQYVREITGDGAYRWDCVLKKTNVWRSTATSIKEVVGAKFSFSPQKAGYYYLSASSKDKDGHAVRASYFFYVMGEDGSSWMARNDDLIQLKTDKNLYKPGETMKILAESPFTEGKAVLTIERESIIDRVVMDFKGSMPVFEIPVKKEYLPNVYVGVVLLKGRTKNNEQEKESLAGPGFKIGYAQVHVSPDELKVNVDISGLKERYEPGEEVEFNIQSSRSTNEFTVAVVDEGVLSLIGFKTPSLFEYFHRSRQLHVGTAESRNYIIEQRSFGTKGDNSGGGGGDAAENGGVNVRRLFLPTAYYNPSLSSDATGKASVRFKLPDDLTTFRVYVVANTRTGYVGGGEQEIIVNKELMLKESLPQFVRPGDSFSAGVVLHNLSGADGKATVTVSANGITLLNSASTDIFMPSGASREIRYSWKESSPGNVELSFVVKMGAKSDALFWPIESIQPMPPETVAMYDSTTSKASQQIIIPLNTWPGTGEIKTTGSSTGLAGLKGTLDFLDHYDYGCLEQRTSKVLPFILSMDLLVDFKITYTSKPQMRELVKDYLRQVPSFQKGDGGFAYWQDCPFSSPYLTCYVVFALLQARDKLGLSFDKDRLDHALDYLDSWVNERDLDLGFPYSTDYDMASRAYAVYVLALAGRDENSKAREFWKSRDKLPLFGRVMLLKAASAIGDQEMIDSLSEMLMNNVKVESRKAFCREELAWGWQWHESTVRSTSMVLQAILEAKGDFVFKDKMIAWLVEERKQKGCYKSTHDNISVFYAFSTFYAIFEKDVPDFKGTVIAAGKDLFSGMFKGRDNMTITKTVPLDSFKPGSKLDVIVNKEGTGTFYYGISMKYMPRGTLLDFDQGFAVKRQFLDYNTLKPVSGAFKLGEKYVVSVEVTTPVERGFVVMEDLMPSSFQVVNPHFQTTSQKDKTLTSSSSGWYGDFSHMEMYKDKYLAFADWLPGGTRTVRYVVQAMVPGHFVLPPARAEEMYNPDVFGRTGQSEIDVNE